MTNHMTTKEIDEVLEKKEQMMREAKIFSDMCVLMATVVKYNVEQMFEMCSNYGIRIGSAEKHAWNTMLNGLTRIHSLAYTLDAHKLEIYKRNARELNVVLKELISRTDNDDMQLYKFYNYIKLFPCVLKEVEVKHEEESKAFAHILDM